MSSTTPDLIANSLLKNKISCLFMVTGGDGMLWIALKKAGIKMYPARSEAAAVYMADGYARVSGLPTMTFGQIGSGATIMAGAMAEPWFSHSPVIALSTSVRTSRKYLSDHHEIDQTRMFDPVTKWNATIPSIHRIEDLISSAIRNSIIGCPGPTHISIPRDFLKSDEKIEKVKNLFNDNIKIYPHIKTEDTKKVIQKITESKRPIILAGAGVLISKAENELKKFAKIFKIPVSTSTGGKGSFMEKDPLSIGVVGQHSRKVANKLIGQADLVIVLGSDLGGMVTNDRKLFSTNVKIIQIDIDIEKIGSTRTVNFPIHSDICSALQDIILESKSKRSFNNSISQEWLTHSQQQVQAWHKSLHRLETRSKSIGTIYHETIMKVLRQKASPTDILVSDTGYAEAWTAAIYPMLKAGRFYLRPAGTLGWAFPAAMGAQLAKPNNRVVCVTGDGGLAYHIGNLETAVRLKIPTITIVLNNQSFAFEHHYQKHLFGKVIPEVNDFAKVDHAEVARAHGAFGAKVNSEKELNEALDQAYLLKGPSIIDVSIDKEALAPVSHYGNKIKRSI